MRTFKFDIMLNGKFVCTLRYKYCALFPIDSENMPEHKLEPFEKVLVRDQKTDKWVVDLYGSKRKVGHYNYMCVGGCCVYCIPYEGNEHLLDTTNSQEE